MSVILQLTPHDPLVARDGRPFGAGQGNRMRGLPWPLPSVVAGSFRTALVKAGSGDFSGDCSSSTSPAALIDSASQTSIRVSSEGRLIPRSIFEMPSTDRPTFSASSS